jgi:hypothetical protein
VTSIDHNQLNLCTFEQLAKLVYVKFYLERGIMHILNWQIVLSYRIPFSRFITMTVYK